MIWRDLYDRLTLVLDLQELKVVLGGDQGGDNQDGQNKGGARDEVAEHCEGAQASAAGQTEHAGTVVAPLLDPL